MIALIDKGETMKMHKKQLISIPLIIKSIPLTSKKKYIQTIILKNILKEYPYKTY